MPLTAPRAVAVITVTRYYAAFNAENPAGMLAELSDDVAHDINQGERQIGRAAFAVFLQHMQRCYRERLRELTIMGHADGRRAAAEFIVDGTYLATDEGFPPARGQCYSLPAGAFFTLDEAGKICRVSMHYNLRDWLAQVT